MLIRDIIGTGEPNVVINFIRRENFPALLNRPAVVSAFVSRLFETLTRPCYRKICFREEWMIPYAAANWWTSRRS